jgi:hypothetical protein
MPVWTQLTRDRQQRPLTYRAWTNRINRAPAWVLEEEGGGVVGGGGGDFAISGRLSGEDGNEMRAGGV